MLLDIKINNRRLFCVVFIVYDNAIKYNYYLVIINDSRLTSVMIHAFCIGIIVMIIQLASLSRDKRMGPSDSNLLCLT